MPLDPPVQEFLDTKPDAGSSEAPIAQRRAAILAGSDRLFDRFGEPAGAVHATTEYALPRGSGTVRIRAYRPSGEPGRPVHVFLHGGGFWLGSIDERVVDATCRERCLGAECVVLAVDYRLAPDHRFPVPVEDCYAALVWAHDNAERFGGDRARISIGGVSAGANLAAAVALAARDRGGPRLTLQLLEVPPLDLTLDTMRSSGVGDDFGMTLGEMELCTDRYLRSAADAHDPLASPLLVPDVSGLPPAQIMTAEFDPLKRDGALFAERLRGAGVPATLTTYPGAVHGSLALTGTWPPAREWRADVIAGLRAAHDRSATAPGAPSRTDQAVPTQGGR